uniref:Arf-GAP with coiled-coil, ANK repeat and PH domain-containing protein n=1 Tax=Kryptolebias marmoratus TaxID=37003 RepID=A0A3Q3AR70_KRYMA
MESLLDFEECIKDSPEFRLCGKMVEAGQAYNSANQLFLSGLVELFVYHRKDTGVVVGSSNKSSHAGLQEMLSFHTVSPVLRFSCLTHVVSDQNPSEKEFVRIREDLETAAVKNAQVSRHKAAEAEQASHLLLATRKCSQHFALDYCLQVPLLVVPQVFSFVHAQFTFFHQGFDLLRDLEPTMKTMAAQVLTSDLCDCSAKRKDLENKHLLVQQRVRTP